MRILLIENEPAAARAVSLMLSGAGFNVEHTLYGEEGLDMTAAYEFDAILLDLSLDDMDGFEVLKELRRRKSPMPVLVVSGAYDVVSKVRALSSGADDYLVKPIHKDELAARIRAVVRRASGHSQSVITIGELSVNLDARTVQVCGLRVHLTGKEFQMLELMALRRGKPVGKDAFLSSLYGGLEEPGPKIIDVFICKLRQKLSAASGGRQFIETVWGGGYVLREPEAMTAKAA